MAGSGRRKDGHVRHHGIGTPQRNTAAPSHLDGDHASAPYRAADITNSGAGIQDADGRHRVQLAARRRRKNRRRRRRRRPWASSIQRNDSERVRRPRPEPANHRRPQLTRHVNLDVPWGGPNHIAGHRTSTVRLRLRPGHRRRQHTSDRDHLPRLCRWIHRSCRSGRLRNRQQNHREHQQSADPRHSPARIRDGQDPPQTSLPGPDWPGSWHGQEYFHERCDRKNFARNLVALGPVTRCLQTTQHYPVLQHRPN
jgi:hypothetical protein